MSNVGLFLSTQEVSELFRHFDVNQDEQIDMQEFLSTLQGEMSDKRLSAVKHAFQFLDTAGSGTLAVQTLLRAYRADRHPRVATREKTADQVKEEFKSAIEAYADASGNLSEGAFLSYYLSQGATIPVEQDDYFINLIIRTWNIEANQPQEKLNELKEVIFEKVRQRVHGNDDEGKVIIKHFRFYDLDSSGALNLSEFSKALSHLGCAFTPQEVNALFQEYDSNKNGLVDYEEFAKFFSIKGSGGNHQFSTERDPPVAVLDKIKNELLRRGPHGMRGLGIILKRMDSNHDRAVDRYEFEWAMRENGQTLSPMELDRVFKYFDRNKSNMIEYQELMGALRGDLNPQRKAAVEAAFQALDTAQSGKLSLNNVRTLYDPTQHPQVAFTQYRSGAKTSEQILNEFIRQWDSVDREGNIAKSDFEEYYRDLSASVARDDEFEQVVRNSWRQPTS